MSPTADGSSRDDVVLLRREDTVLHVTLNRPQARNALDDASLDSLLAAWEAARSPEVRAVVITGNGPAFCAGADLRAPARGPAEIAVNQRRRYNANVLAMRSLPKAIVAAVNGPAVGAGLSLVCAADVRIASERATFAPAFARLGSVPDMGASYTLPRLVGEGRAFDWLCSNRVLGADEALAWGLVNELVTDGELLGRATERALALAAMPGEAVQLTKALLQQSAATSLAEQLDREVEAQVRAVASPARDEARAAVARATRTSNGEQEDR